MKNVVIVNALRTPTGRFLGGLSSLSPPQLGAAVIRELIQQSGIKASLVDEVIMGNVVSAGIGQNPARQACLLAGLPHEVASLTINKVCGSGLKAVALGVQAIKSGDAKIVIAGGMECMSQAPFLLQEMRSGKKLGNVEAIDSVICDGLWDSYYDSHMGTLCEHTVKKYKITREEQDLFALQSHQKAMVATKKGSFHEEIVPVKVKLGKKEVLVERDESIRPDTNLEKLGQLKPAFKKGGTITAGNAPGLNDGASALLLMQEETAEKLGLKPLARIVGYASGHMDPKWYTVAPVKAIKEVMKKTGTKIGDFDFIELNEAFAAQALAVIKKLDLDTSIVNVNGGGIALGHPIGASGARILVTLTHILRSRRKKLGLAALCLGGGGAVSMVIEVNAVDSK